ncbi:hypothetical protein KNT59_gp111 [Klebsiella phage KPV15]|uniref:Uncharacterized protein n=1 Tax=Klebsiella phage KPV15 TaxID=1913572 RepID=A0A1J0MH17_9CAUD|nr:hypothetical protein [Klebsiella variicola]YP_010089392.1 hypothetical protein KNT59_gp111 [Klebsiella phage KPV15]QLF82950.1 hypothetical protein KpnM6E1_gp067 [Klebsiella phage KpnM6E1]UOK17689.1 hypothetical protein KP1079_00083 [Klebsiella phage KP1079]USL86906.1 hypothetical protein [Salmonella phage PSE-D1]UWG89104.1 MAG: hypothetical protein [Bacteriophage sp.]WNO28954.1 hypothetical protein vBKpnMJEC_0067 [Klebsiella phage vB_KpnM-JEC]
MKTTGALWKEFYNDEAFWEGYYHDDTLILFDDVEVEEYEDPSPDAVVKIESGYVYKTDDFFTSHDLSLETFFKRWKKKQTARTMVVTVDKDNFDEVFETISNIPGVKKVK